nr:putative Holliday junction resolvase [Oceanusvirus sp.]
MRVLSIDVGTKNLGACDVEASADGKSFRIHRWCVLTSSERGTTAVDEAIRGAVAAMRDLCGCEADGGGGSCPWDRAVIENQPCMKNPRMKAVQTAIHTFLAMRPEDPDVVLAGAAGKNKVADKILGKDEECGATSGARYRRAKKRSVEATKALLGSATDGRHDEWLAKLATHPKKDDMCDAFLQAIYFLSDKERVFSVDQICNCNV